MRDLLLLMRAPLGASAAANLVLAAALAGAEPGVGLGLLATASLCLYWAGMVLNDLFDLERDRRLQPRRPLPAGRVTPGAAAALGLGLLAAGVLLAGAGGALLGAGGRGLAGGAAVAACVLTYDAWLKRYRLAGSAAMAACRLTHALLAPWVLGAWPGGGPWPGRYAAALGVYVLALTWLSTWEDEDAPPAALGAGWLGVLAAPGLLALAPLLGRDGPGAVHPAVWAGALPLLALLLDQAVAAVVRGTRARGPAGTRVLLRAVWLLDATVALAAGAWAVLPLLAGLFAAGTWGAKALFAPPPGARPEGSARPE